MTVLNINAGNNQALLDRCRTLREYMQYVDCVRHYISMPGMLLEDAVAKAVDECIEKDILADFLRRNKAEAMSISIFEYNEVEEKEKMRKAEYAGGYRDGVEKGSTLKLISQVCIKMKKGKIPEVIAEELEEDLCRIMKIYDAVEKSGVECKPEKIFDTLGDC